MTFIFAGIIFLLTNLVSAPVLSGQEEKIAIWEIKKEKIMIIFSLQKWQKMGIFTDPSCK